MSEKIGWTVSGGQPGAKKAPYAPKQKLKEGMSESEKGGVRIWNAWHDVLKENGLMEDK
ncbi:hypothetical protein D3C75_340290 [compost metagenome]